MRFKQLTKVESASISIVPSQRIDIASSIIARVDDVQWLQISRTPDLDHQRIQCYEEIDVL